MSGTFTADLDVSDPPVVVGISDPPSQLLLFSGIITDPSPESKGQILGNCDDNTSRMTLTLHLKRTATRILQSSSTASLASVQNDGGSFVLAADSSVVQLDSTTGELTMVVQLAVNGDEGGFLDFASCAYINRISYSAQVLVDIPAPLISGFVRWDDAEFGFAGWPALSIAAGFWVTTPGGPGTFGTSTWVVVATGILDESILSGGVRSSSYVIQGVPFGKPVQVVVTAMSNFTIKTGGGSVGFNRQDNLTDPIMLTPGEPQQTNVDFLAEIIPPVH